MLCGAAVGLALAVRLVAGATEAPPIQSGSPPTKRPTAVTATRTHLPGLRNFGTVSDQLYRGAQPNQAGFDELKRRRIDIVVNLRDEDGRIHRERELVEARGMQYVSIPWRGWDEPNVSQVAQFLSLLRDNPGRRVFVHCARGAERTGVMVASYRISRDHWTPEQAVAEMRAFGFRSRFRHLRRFVERFPALLLQDPSLRWEGRYVDWRAHGRTPCVGSRTAAGCSSELDSVAVAEGGT
jgi:protein tyrosine phosphatase (PTP) superfamily phosphohydrolase (DUF442 family)